MNTIQKICPNFLTHYIRLAFIYLSKKFTKKKKSYDGLHQFQEQEFSIHSFPKDTIDEENQIPPTENDNYFERKQQSQMFSSEDTSTSQYHQIFAQLNKLPIKLNLQPYDRYYLLLQQKIKNVDDLFLNASQTEINFQEFQNSKSMFRISQIPVSTGFKFIITAVLPCSYAFYNQTVSETINITELTKHVKRYVRHQSIYSNLTVMGLQFKKILGLGLQPRCFTYIKYQNSPQNGYNFEICASVANEYDDDQSEEQEMGRKTLKEADIYSVTKIKEHNESIYLKTYLQIDLKSIIRAHKIVRKGIKQIGQYYEQLYQHVAENYQKQVV